MSIFKKTIKYSKPLRDLDGKIKNLDEELQQTGVIVEQDDPEILCVQESSVEKLPKIYDRLEVQKEKEILYNWRESFIVEETNDEPVVIDETYHKTVGRVERYISESNKELIEIRDQVFQEISESTLLNLPEIKCKIEKVLEIYDQIQEGLLNEPPSTKNSDPLTPLDQNFVTIEDLNKHYNLFVNRIQEQIATIGGGGEYRFQYLDGIVGIQTNSAAYNGKYLQWNSATNKAEFVTVSGGAGSQTLNQTLGLGNTSSLGMSVGVVTATSINFASGGVLGDLYTDGGIGIGLKSPANYYAVVASNNLQQFLQVDDNQIFIGTGYASTTGTYDWKFDKNGVLTFPNGALNISGNKIRNVSESPSLVAGSQIEVTQAKTVITNGQTNYIDGIPSLTSQYLFELGQDKILSSFQTINMLDANSGLVGERLTELTTDGFKIGLRVTTLGEDPLTSFNGWTFGTIGVNQALTFPDDTVQYTAYTGYASTAGVSTYATRSGIATYAQTAGIATSAGTATTATNLADAANITTGTINKDRISTTGTLSVLGDLYVSNNISFGGTTTQLNTQQLQIVDADIVLGIGTSFSPTDNTANHGGIAIASTEGTPLVSLNIVPGETNPTTYKKIMWFKGSTIGAGLTDAWLFNYGVGIGSTQVPNGIRLAVGGIQMTDSTITATTFSGNATSATYSNTSGIATYATSAGVSTIAGYATTAGISTISQGLTGTPNISVGVITATDYRIQSVAEKTTLVGLNTANLVYNTGGGNIAICTNPSGDITLNVTGIPTASSFDNYSLAFSVIVTNTGTARSCTAVNLNGVSRTIKWFGGSLTSAISGVTTSNGYDVYSFTGINTVGSASTTANYIVLGSVNGSYR